MDASAALVLAANLSIVALLVLLNGFFVAAEFAIVKVRAAQLDAAAAGPRRDAARHVLRHMDAYLSACQLGITMASLGLGWVGEPVVSHLIVAPLLGRFLTDPDAIRGLSFAAAFLLITAVHIVVGEQAPKYVGIREPKRSMLWVALPLRIFRTSLAPLIWLLNASANRLVRLVGIRPVSEGEAELTIDDLRVLLAQAPAAGEKSARRSAEVASRVFGLQDIRVGEIMVPRERVVSLDIRRPFAENLRRVRDNPFTRFPLADGGLDSIVGFVHQRDVFAMAERDAAPRLEALRRDVLVARPGQRASVALFEMLERRRRMTIVLDDAGRTAGLLTLEDLFEQFVGEISGEFDRYEERIRVLEPGRYLIDGACPIPELQLVLLEPLEDRLSPTLVAMLARRLGRAPVQGDVVAIGAYEYAVIEADEHRLRRVEVRRVEAPAGASGGAAAEPA